MILQQFYYAWSGLDSPQIKSYTLTNFQHIPQIKKLSKEEQFEMAVGNDNSIDSGGPP